MRKVAIRSVLVLILLGMTVWGSGCSSSTGESGLALDDDRSNLLFFHSEY